jgi:uroporphyrinogen-III decarboxylase
MNSRERLLAALRGKEVDRIPWAPLIDGYYTSSLPQQGYNMNIVETLRYIGADILERHVPVIKTLRKNVERKVTTKGDEEIEELVTPVGSINQISSFTKGGKTRFLTKPLVNNEQDAKVLQYIYENTYYEPNFKAFENQQTYIGEDGLATISSPLTPIQQLLQHIMHIEPFTYGIYDFEDTLMELMEVMHHNNLKAYSLMAQSPAEVVFAYEDTSTTVMSPSWYDSYCKDYIDQYADIIHEGGKVFITHMCGKLKGFQCSILNGKMDGIDSVCPPTTGDTWLHEAVKAWPDKVIIGGIEPPALRRMNVEQTHEYIMDVLSKISKNDKIILSTGDATSFGTPIENLLEVTKIVRNYNSK